MAETSILPSETPIATHWGTGSLGSETVALECRDPGALKRAVEALSERFRKVYLDGARGIALLMAPTRHHDRTSYDMVDLVRGLAACKSIAVEGFGGGRWENEMGDRRSEPDESFYVGEVAEAYRALRLAQDWAAVEAFEEAHPATLVVEVEHTHYAAEKRELCRALGMVELWEVGTRHARRPPAIVELQGPEGPRELGASGLIPGVRPEYLREALRVLEEIGGLLGLARGLERGDGGPERLMRAAGMGLS